MRITKKQYKKNEPYLPKPRGNFVVDHLTVLNAILYVDENGCEQRALPRRYGHWNTVYRRFRRWAESGVLSQVMEVLQNEALSNADFSVLSLDSTFVKASPCAAGALKKNGPQAIGRTKGGRTTKIHAIVAGPTTPVALKLTPGNAGDAPVGREILRNLDVKRLKSKFVLMDRAYEGDETRQTARDVGLKPVVPSKRNRRKLWRYNKKLYKRRNEIERFFRRIQDFRRIATRCDKLDVMFSA
ncbi:MAG: IS5 family transposase, partial [Thermoguttaceae bacterium]|nr:IS5 family transposase [Thermoguttaceae bacterium]